VFGGRVEAWWGLEEIMTDVQPPATRGHISDSLWATLLGASVLVTLIGWMWLGWLLWRYVPLHAALFAGLSTPPPRLTAAVIELSMWFVRLLPFLLLAVILLGSRLMVPLYLRATRERDRGATRTLLTLLACAGLTAFGGGVIVLHAMRTGCVAMVANPSYQSELKGLEAAGYHPCR
jgi:hypothetical protein